MEESYATNESIMQNEKIDKHTYSSFLIYIPETKEAKIVFIDIDKAKWISYKAVLTLYIV